MLMKNIVAFTGAGVSDESGLSTFRDNGGIWDEFPVEEVATLNAWEKNPIKVIEFYNLRRKLCLMAKPNMAHKNIQKLEKKFNVRVRNYFCRYISTFYTTIFVFFCKISLKSF